jgi:methyltransferase (TIGR00027 family)
MERAAEPILKIELPDVADTALVTLQCRALESQSLIPILDDPKAVAVVAALGPMLANSDLELHRSLARGEVDGSMQIYVALRSRHFDRQAREFLGQHPDGWVVNLGCGLDTRRWRLDSDRVVDVDLPEMVALRSAVLNDEAIAGNVTDHRWMDAIAERGAGPFLFLAEGLFMYLPADRLRSLVIALAGRFPGSQLTAEVFNSFWLASERREEIETRLTARLHFGRQARFVSGISDGDEMETWAEGIRLLDEWSFLDEEEPKLGRLRKLRHFPQFRKRQWVARYELGPALR